MLNIYILSSFLFFFGGVRNEVILHKSQLESYKINSNQPVLKWKFDADTLFDRLNSFLKRLLDVNEIIDAANGFMKLGKIEMGGIKGRHLSERIESIQNEFHTLYTLCIANHTNVLEPSNKQFKSLKRNFKTKIAILERKLSQILVETFENCNSIESSIKIIEMFGNLLQRPIIHEQIAPQIHAIIKHIQMEIATVHNLFNGHLYDDWITMKIVCIVNKFIYSFVIDFQFHLCWCSSTICRIIQ